MGIKTELPWLPELKPGWKQSRLKDILLEIYSGGTPDSKVEEYYADWEDVDKGIPWAVIADIPKQERLISKTTKRVTPKGLKAKPMRVVPKGTILYSTQASPGQVCVTDIEMVISQSMVALVEDQSVIDKNFLYYYLMSMKDHISYFAQTNTQSNINQDIVGNMIIVYPESIAEQKQIAEELKEKDDLIIKLIIAVEQKIDLTNQAWKTFLVNQIVGNATGNEIGGSEIFFDKELVSGWIKSRIKDVILDVHSGGTPDSKVVEYYCSWEDSGTPWCSIGDIPKNSYFLNKTQSRLTKLGYESKKLRIVPKGTILYSIYASLGEVCVTNIDTTINQAILALYENPEVIEQKYFYYYLLFLKDYLTYFANTNIQNNLNQEIVGNLIVMHPKDLEAQKIIAKQIQEKELKVLETLKLLKEKILLLNKYKMTVIFEKTSGK